MSDGGADLRWGGFEIGVDKNVALRGDDEEGGEVSGADVIEVAGYFEGREGSVPIRGYGVAGGNGEEECGKVVDFH